MSIVVVYLSPQKHMLNETQFLALLNRQQESGLDVKAFCSNEGINVSTFYYWRKKTQKSSPAKDFIPLVVKTHQSAITQRYTKGHQRVQTDTQQMDEDTLLELVYPNGTKLRIKNDLDLSQLRALINLYP